MSNKRTQLIEASIELFYKEGFWNTPTTKIAKHASVATGTLFNYFETKDVLIECVYQQLRQEWSRHVMVDFPENDTVKARFEHVWFRHVDWGLRNPDRYALVGQLRVSDSLKNRVRDRDTEEMSFVFELIEEGYTQGLFDEDISINYFGSLLRMNLDTAIRYAHRFQLKEMKLMKHMTKSFELFWRGVAH